MTTDKFLETAAPARAQLDDLLGKLHDLVDAGIAHQETGHLVESAAGGVAAALQLLDIAIAQSPPGGFVP